MASPLPPPPAADPVFHVEHLSLAYPAGRGQAAVPILEDVSFEVDRGTSLTLVGPSGSGKSTLLRCLNRLEEPTRGRVRFEGREITSLKLLELRRRAALVLQTPVLFEGTVRDNLRTQPASARADLSEPRLVRALTEGPPALSREGQGSGVRVHRQPGSHRHRYPPAGLPRGRESLARAMTGNAAIIDLSVWQLGLAVLLVGVVIVISARQALGLERDLVVGTVRTIVQLYLVGLILTSVFAAARWYWVVLVLAGMTIVATQAAVSRLKRPIPGRYAIDDGRAGAAPGDDDRPDPRRRRAARRH